MTPCCQIRGLASFHFPHGFPGEFGCRLTDADRLREGEETMETASNALVKPVARVGERALCLFRDRTELYYLFIPAKPTVWVSKPNFTWASSRPNLRSHWMQNLAKVGFFCPEFLWSCEARGREQLMSKDGKLVLWIVVVENLTILFTRNLIVELHYSQF